MKSTSRFFRGNFKISGADNNDTNIFILLTHSNKTPDEEQIRAQVTSLRGLPIIFIFIHRTPVEEKKLLRNKLNYYNELT